MMNHYNMQSKTRMIFDFMSVHFSKCYYDDNTALQIHPSLQIMIQFIWNSITYFSLKSEEGLVTSGCMLTKVNKHKSYWWFQNLPIGILNIIRMGCWPPLALIDSILSNFTRSSLKFSKEDYQELVYLTNTMNSPQIWQNIKHYKSIFHASENIFF